MDNRVNISKIARDLNLSVSTVSRALSGNGRVSTATKNTILEYLRTKELAPNTRNKRYSDIITNTITVVLPGESENDFAGMPYFHNIFLSVYDYFSIRGYQVNMIKIMPDDISNLKNSIEKHIMDGVILTRTVNNYDEIRLLQEYEVPFVLIGSIEDSSVLQVDVDTETASRDLTNAILHKGLHKIAVMCAQKEHSVNKRRLKGILDAHRQCYMLLDRDYVFYDSETSNMAEMAIEKIIAGNMDCILCMDDNICMNVLLLLRKMGISVPGQIKIASLHNNAILDEWYPPISCIHYNVEELGKEASRMLHVLLTEHKHLPKSIVGFELQMKESTNERV